MKALNSLVKMLWVVMTAFIAIGWLLSDRGRMKDELRQVHSEIVELQVQHERELQQWQSYAAGLEQALNQEQQARRRAELLTEELQRQLATTQQALDAARDPGVNYQATDPAASQPQLVPVNTGEGASASTVQLASVTVPATVGALLSASLVALIAGRRAVGRQNRHSACRDRRAAGQPIALQPVILRPVHRSESIRRIPIVERSN